MKIKYIRKIAALAICAAMLTGCSGGNDPKKTEVASDTSESQITDAPVSSESRSAAAIASEDDPVAQKETKPLTIAVGEVHADYSPFGASDTSKDLMDSLTGVTLLGLTRSGATILSGKSGQKESFGSKTYEYNGIADTEILTDDEETGVRTYKFTLRDDVKFSDGQPLTSDDVIFTLYALLDPSCEESPLFDAGIVGADNYRYDSEIAETLTEAEIAEALASEAMIPIIKEKLIVPVLENQYKSVRSMYDGSSDAMGTGTYDVYTQMYPDPVSLFVFLYSLNSEYTAPDDADNDTIISDIADMYKGNYKQLASMTEGNNKAYDQLARRIAIGYITESRLKDDETPAHVTNITGISRIDEHSLSITVCGSGAALEKALATTVIAPLHYYGSMAKFNITADSFGFDKGNAAAVFTAHTDAPLGAGAYVFSSYTDGEILLTANENYYLGAPLIADIRILRNTSGDATSLIADGTADVSFADGSVKLYEAIDEANLKLERIYPAVSNDHGYGYIGINARTVNVGSQPLSDESSALRAALMTAICFYRNASVYAYYGERGIVTDYPFIENVAIDSSAEEITSPYSLNKDGEPIFTVGMNDAQHREAVKTACLGFFKAAGYTLTEDEKKVAEAPEGGKLVFNAIISAGGTGSHPAFYALSKACEMLSEIGITLNITDVTDANSLWESLSSGTQEIWAGAWNNTLREIYIDGYYGIKSDDLEKLVAAAETAAAEDRNAAYLACYDLVLNKLAVELPLYRKTSCILFSTQRIDVSAIATDLTGSFDWTREIYKIKLK